MTNNTNELIQKYQEQAENKEQVFVAYDIVDNVGQKDIDCCSKCCSEACCAYLCCG